jgi:hypothetical protein
MSDTKQLHISLNTPDQVADYVVVRTALGIRRDADLIRYLLRKEARSLCPDAYLPRPNPRRTGGTEPAPSAPTVCPRPTGPAP